MERGLFFQEINIHFLKNKSDLDINVHQDKDKFWNLRMVAISGGMTAEEAVEGVENKLTDFSLFLYSHIVAVVTDGASDMAKFGWCELWTLTVLYGCCTSWCLWRFIQ